MLFMCMLCAATARGQSGYEQAVLDPALRTHRYFPLADAAGGVFLDRSLTGPGIGSTGQLVGGPSNVAGPLFRPTVGGDVGGGLSFNGVDQHGLVDIDDFASAFDDPAGASVVVWFRAFERSRGALLGCFDEAVNRGGFQLLVGANHFYTLPNQYQITFAVTFPSGDFVTASVQSVDYDAGDWHMLVATYQVTEGEGVARLYMDGVSSRMQTFKVGGTGRLAHFRNQMAIGGAGDGTVNTRKRAEMAHVSLHRKALSAEQAMALWLAGNGSTGASVYNIGAVRPWFAAAQNQRVDVGIMGDSNLLYSTPSGMVGHQYGMLQGLKAVLPVYASALLPGSGAGGWVLPTNGISPVLSTVGSPGMPAFISNRVPAASAGFSSNAAYVNGSQEINAGEAARGALAWQSPEFPFDFQKHVQWHVTYATFAGGSGVIRPAIAQLDAPYTAIVESSVSTGGAQDGVAQTVLDLPAGARAMGSNYTLQVVDKARGLSATGPIGLLYSRLVLPEVTAGAAMTPVWGVGGVSARYAADKFVNWCSIPQLSEMLRQIVRHQPVGQERLMFNIIEGGNDLADVQPAVQPNGLPDIPLSSTMIGQKINTLTIMLRVRDAWSAAGYDTSRLCFLLGPYHPLPGNGPKIRSVYVRGWRELARDYPNLNIAVMDGYGFSSVEEFLTGGWYDQNGPAHLTRAGYLNFGLKTWAALAAAVAGGQPAAGACCMGATCQVLAPDVCATNRGRAVGVGAACNGAGDVARPCCRGDFDQSGVVGVDDVFAYLGAWFTGDVRADVVSDGAGVPGIDSLFAYLAAWFGGC